MRTWVFVAALAALTLTKGCVWVGVAPLWKIADEPAHFDHVTFRAETGRAPAPTGEPVDQKMSVGASQELHESWEATRSYWRTHFLPGVRAVPEEQRLRWLAKQDKARQTNGQMTSMHYPGLFYRAGAVVYRLFLHKSIVLRAFAVRCVAVGFGLLAVLCTFFAARRIVDDPWIAFAAAAIMSLQPMASQQTATVNNDAAVIGLSALVFYLQVRVLARWPSLPSLPECTMLGLATGLNLLTKPQAFALVPGTALALAVVLWPHRRERRAWARLALATAAFVVVALPAVIQLRGTLHAFEALNRAHLPKEVAEVPGFVAWVDAIPSSYWDFLFKSFWGFFGWLDDPLGDPWFNWLHGLGTLCAIGLAAALALRTLTPAQTPLWWSRRGLAWSILTSVATFLFILLTEWHARKHVGVSGVIQGRNFLMALPAFAVVIVIALGSLVPRRLRGVVVALVVTGIVLVNVASLVTVVRYNYGA